MTCNCNKEGKKEMDDDHECPEGQSYDVSQGKCVAKNGDKKDDKAESAFGDPKTTDVEGDVASSGADVGDDNSAVEDQQCGEGHHRDETSQLCVPDEAAADKTDDIGQTNTNIATERTLKRIEANIQKLSIPASIFFTLANSNTGLKDIPPGTIATSVSKSCVA